MRPREEDDFTLLDTNADLVQTIKNQRIQLNRQGKQLQQQKEELHQMKEDAKKNETVIAMQTRGYERSRRDDQSRNRQNDDARQREQQQQAKDEEQDRIEDAKQRKKKQISNTTKDIWGTVAYIAALLLWIGELYVWVFPGGLNTAYSCICGVIFSILFVVWLYLGAPLIDQKCGTQCAKCIKEDIIGSFVSCLIHCIECCEGCCKLLYPSKCCKKTGECATTCRTKVLQGLEKHQCAMKCCTKISEALAGCTVWCKDEYKKGIETCKEQFEEDNFYNTILKVTRIFVAGALFPFGFVTFEEINPILAWSMWSFCAVVLIILILWNCFVIVQLHNYKKHLKTTDKHIFYQHRSHQPTTPPQHVESKEEKVSDERSQDYSHTPRYQDTSDHKSPTSTTLQTIKQGQDTDEGLVENTNIINHAYTSSGEERQTDYSQQQSDSNSGKSSSKNSKNSKNLGKISSENTSKNSEPVSTDSEGSGENELI